MTALTGHPRSDRCESATYVEIRVPPVVYLFGFLGATVYVFTSFAKRFGEADRYRLKVLSRTVAVLPLAAGVYLLAFAFPGVSGELSVLDPSTGETTVSSSDRVVAGLVFLAGIYVSAALRALGGLAERLLGIAPSRSTEATDAFVFDPVTVECAGQDAVRISVRSRAVLVYPGLGDRVLPVVEVKIDPTCWSPRCTVPRNAWRHHRRISACRHPSRRL